MEHAGVPDRVRDQFRFTAVHLAPHTAERDEDRDPSLTGTRLLRSMDIPLVDPGQETKAAMLVSYQDQLRAGKVTNRTRGALGKAVSMLTLEDRVSSSVPDQCSRDERAVTADDG
ncbi:hypothetical protein [Nocardia sp. NPDC003345]